MTPDELRQRMIEVARKNWLSQPSGLTSISDIVDALLAAGAVEQWVMPWMVDVLHYDVEDQPFYRMKEPK